jgi:iron-sulfur cluster assembly protein
METIETIADSPVRFTEHAVYELRKVMDGELSSSGRYLRVGVKGGGCTGLSYVLGFDERSEKDDIYESEGLRFIMNKAHGIYLWGMEIDWQDGLNARGFSFRNPNASKTCGCGSSFAV